MKISKRLEQAMHKLYTAYHANTLNPECCKQCAVGNIADHKDAWKNFSEHHGSVSLNYVGTVHERIGRRINGYLPSELLQIEKTFLEACGFETPLSKNSKRPTNPTDMDVLFQGLSETIAYLCQLEGNKNVMEYTSIFKQHSLSINVHAVVTA